MSRAELHYYTNANSDNAMCAYRLCFEDEKDTETKVIAIVDKDSTAIADFCCLYRFEENEQLYESPEEIDIQTKFEKKIHKSGLGKKLIIGIELKAYDDIAETGISGQVTVLIKNINGHNMLNKYMNSVITKSKSDEIVYKLSELANLTNDIFLGSCARDGIVKNVYCKDKKKLSGIFEKIDYIEINPYDEREYITYIVNEAEKMNLKIVATNQPHSNFDVFKECSAKKEYSMNNSKFMTETDLIEMLSYLGEEKATKIVCDNSKALADCCKENCVNLTKECNYPKIENDDEMLLNICMSRLETLYGNNIPQERIARLNKELEIVKYNKCEFVFILLHKVIKLLNADATYVSINGTGSNSYIAFLCGISEIDPFEYGLDMHSFYFNKLKIGWLYDEIANKSNWLEYADFEKHIDLRVPDELKDKIYRYFNELEEISDIYLYTKNPEYLKMNNTDFDIDNCELTQYIKEDGIILVPQNCDINIYSTLYKNSGRLFFRYGCGNSDMPFYKQAIVSGRKNTMLYELAKETGVNLSDITDDNEQIISLLKSSEIPRIKEMAGNSFGCYGIPFCDTENVSKIIRNGNIKCFLDLVKCIGMAHSSYEDRDMFSSLCDKKCIDWDNYITCREDVLDILLKLDFEYEFATEIMDYIRGGAACRNKRKIYCKKWKEYSQALLDGGVDDKFLKACEQITYLHSRSHAINEAKIIWKLIYFKINYPKEFYKVFFKHCNYKKLVEAVEKGKSDLHSYIDKMESTLKFVNYNKLRDIMVAKEMLVRDML